MLLLAAGLCLAATRVERAGAWRPGSPPRRSAAGPLEGRRPTRLLASEPTGGAGEPGEPGGPGGAGEPGGAGGAGGRGGGGGAGEAAAASKAASDAGAREIAAPSDGSWEEGITPLEIPISGDAVVVVPAAVIAVVGTILSLVVWQQTASFEAVDWTNVVDTAP